MTPSHTCREPQHLDLIISNGSHAATGFFDVVLKSDDGKFKLYPVQFLHDDDDDFSRLKKSISGTTCPEKICPVGKLKQVWKKEI